ncbi:MAG: 3-phosphoshikimate 1-carboxyvinyltransferase [Rhodothermales bacterium]
MRPATGLASRVLLPADKSVSHRAALLAALADGDSEIVGFSDAADPHATLACLQALGVACTFGPDSLVVHGRGGRFTPPTAPLDCGNSGTTMRLLAGLLAGQPFDSVLTGDASLRGRPMARIADPLRQMGAHIELTDGHAPIHIAGRQLRGIEYELPVASAQVKSCVLLAGLLAEGTTTVIEPIPSRDHTERMLGLDVLELGGQRTVTVEGGRVVKPGAWIVPRDFSAAAFFLVAGATNAHSHIEVKSVGLNPTRSAFLDVLRAMGATVTVSNERTRHREPLADLTVQNDGGRLHGVSVSGNLIPNLIDEIPILAVAAACAEGRTEIRDAAELRVKETDRLAATAAFLTAMGADVEELEDGLIIEGGRPLHGATVESEGDHRIAMAAAVAALTATGEATIRDADCVAVSFPAFWDEFDRLTGAAD